MRSIILKKLCIYLAALLPTIVVWPAKAQSQYDGYIIGSDKHQNRVYIMDPDKKNLNNGVVWSLSPEDLKGVAPGELPEVGGAEVKRVMGGTHILLIAKRVILVRIADKRVIWHGRIGGGEAHSAELLPDGNIVVAAPKTPALKFFDTSMPNNSLPVNEYKFKNAHGVVWDAKRKVLWATGSDLLHGLYYNFDKHNPDVSGVFQENNIEPNGHDLYPVPGEDKLLYTGKDMWVFDIKNRTHTKIGDKGAKSMTQKEPNGEIIYTVGSGSGNPYGISKFQTPIIKSLTGPDRTFTGAGFYKVRWFVPCQFSYPEYDGQMITNAETELENKIQVNIYPNPTNDFLNVTIDNGLFSECKMRIINVSGEVVKEGIARNTNEIRLDLSNLSKGVYHLSLRSSEGKIGKKVIVK